MTDDVTTAQPGDAGAQPEKIVTDVGVATPQPEVPAKDQPAPEPIGAQDAPDEGSDVKPDWPEDWREKMAGGDDKFLAQLKRYASPASFAKAGFEAQSKIRSGEYKRPLASDAKPEEIAAWRKENGLPEKPEDFKLELGGFIPSDSDKPVLDAFQKLAFERNMTPQQASELTQWYFNQQEQANIRQQQADVEFRQQAIDELRGEWGTEFRANVNAMKNFINATAPEGLMDKLLGARLGDGRILGDDPDALRWLVGIAREQLPGAELVPAGEKNITKGVEARLQEISEMRWKDHAKYWSPAIQKEEQELIAAQLKLTGKAA